MPSRLKGNAVIHAASDTLLHPMYINYIPRFKHNLCFVNAATSNWATPVPLLGRVSPARSRDASWSVPHVLSQSWHNFLFIFQWCESRVQDSPPWHRTRAGSLATLENKAILTCLELRMGLRRRKSIKSIECASFPSSLQPLRFFL